MGTLWLHQQVVKTLSESALSGQPDEICGLLSGPSTQITQVIPIRNIAANPQQRFEMDPEEFVRAMVSLERSGQRLLGIYHSHPKSAPIPSLTDVRYAAYPDTPYIIIGLHGGKVQLAAWRIGRDKQVDKLDLHIGLHPPVETRQTTISPAQKTALIGSLLIAFALIIMISLALLPPAPPIP